MDDERRENLRVNQMIEERGAGRIVGIDSCDRNVLVGPKRGGIDDREWDGKEEGRAGDDPGRKGRDRWLSRAGKGWIRSGGEGIVTTVTVNGIFGRCALFRRVTTATGANSQIFVKIVLVLNYISFRSEQLIGLGEANSLYRG